MVFVKKLFFSIIVIQLTFMEIWFIEYMKKTYLIWGSKLKVNTTTFHNIMVFVKKLFFSIILYIHLTFMKIWYIEYKIKTYLIRGSKLKVNLVKHMIFLATKKKYIIFS